MLIGEKYMETEEIAELNRKLNTLIALTLCQLEDRADPSEVIAVLTRFDIKAPEIAAILGMTANAVRIVQHRQRRSSRRANAKGKKE